MASKNFCEVFANKVKNCFNVKEGLIKFKLRVFKMIKKIFSILIAVFLIAFSFLILNFRRVEAARTTWTESCNTPIAGGCISISCGPDEAGDCTDATCTNPAQWCPDRDNASSVNDCAVSATPSCSCKGIRIPIDGFEWFYYCGRSGDCTKTGLCTYTCNPGFYNCDGNNTNGCESSISCP